MTYLRSQNKEEGDSGPASLTPNQAHFSLSQSKEIVNKECTSISFKNSNYDKAVGGEKSWSMMPLISIFNNDTSKNTKTILLL